MNGNLLALMTRSVTGSNRRRVLGFGSAGVLTTIGARLDGPEAEAKKRKKKAGTPLQVAFQCPGPPSFISTCNGACRLAQVFRTTRGGRLSRIQFSIDKPAGSTGDYVVQLLRVDNSDTPLHAPLDMLAATTVADADVPEGESLLTANFAGPRLEAQTDYAAAVGRMGGQIRFGAVPNTSCGGQLFVALGLGPFDSDIAVSSSPYSLRSGALAIAGEG